MEIEGKAGEGYGGGGSCWLLCVVVVVVTTVLATLLVEKLRSGQPKWPIFPHSLQKGKIVKIYTQLKSGFLFDTP